MNQPNLTELRDQMAAEMREVGEQFKCVPFAPEAEIDRMVEQRVAFLDLIIAGICAAAVPQQENQQ